MVHGESQRDSRERACIGRIAVAHGLGVDLRAFRVGGTEDDDNVFSSELLGSVLDTLLILQVHRSRGGSDEALRHGEFDGSAARLQTCLHGGSGDAVPLTEEKQFLACQFAHFSTSFLLYRVPSKGDFVQSLPMDDAVSRRAVALDTKAEEASSDAGSARNELLRLTGGV
jgi:hypothetical protein